MATAEIKLESVNFSSLVARKVSSDSMAKIFSCYMHFFTKVNYI